MRQTIEAVLVILDKKDIAGNEWMEKGNIIFSGCIIVIRSPLMCLKTFYLHLNLKILPLQTTSSDFFRRSCV